MKTTEKTPPMDVMLSIMKKAGGNPGSLSFLMQLLNGPQPQGSAIIIGLMTRHPTIKGGDLYILYSDLAGKDLDKVKQLVHRCPPEILADACSRQDYSGRALVAEYLLPKE